MIENAGLPDRRGTFTGFRSKVYPIDDDPGCCVPGREISAFRQGDYVNDRKTERIFKDMKPSMGFQEVYGGSVEGPYVNGDQFAVRFKFDVTPKATGQRAAMDGVGLYTVKNGKITEERFYH